MLGLDLAFETRDERATEGRGGLTKPLRPGRCQNALRGAMRD